LAGDERLAQHPVDVLLAGQFDEVEAGERVGQAPGPHLETGLAQDAAEG